MIFRWLLRDKTPDTAYTAYASIVRQSRLPAFYTGFAVPDTLDGRFDMIVMHVVLYTKRLFGESAEGESFGQLVFDLFIKDMDHSLRERGIGDMSIARKMKHVGESYYGREKAYRTALEAGDAQALAEAISRNLFTEDPNPVAARALATYMIKADEDLQGQALSELAGDSIQWPDPMNVLDGTENDQASAS